MVREKSITVIRSRWEEEITQRDGTKRGGKGCDGMGRNTVREAEFPRKVTRSFLPGYGGEKKRWRNGTE